MNLYEIVDEPLYFPVCEETRSLHICDELTLPEDLRTYLSDQPTKQRKVGAWLWNAPENIRRGIDEPGYAMAIKQRGMGHVEVLYWNHETGFWVPLPMGGSNYIDSLQNHRRFMAKDVTGYEASVKSQMKLCKSDLLFSRRK